MYCTSEKWSRDDHTEDEIRVIITLTIFRFSVGDFFSLFHYLRSVKYNCENHKGLVKFLGVTYDTPISESDKGLRSASGDSLVARDV